MQFGKFGLSFQKRKSPIIGIQSYFVRILALVMGLLLLAIFFLFIGVDPIELYLDLIEVNIRLFPSTLGIFITLLILAVGLAIPFKARIDNIGAEGQYIMGTIAATGTAFTFPYLPPYILIPLMFINGFIAGAIWAIPVVIFRTKGGFQGSDVVVSFLMVFPALFIMEYLVSGPWRDPETGFTYSSRIPEAGQIPSLNEFLSGQIPIGLPFEIGGFPLYFNVPSFYVLLFVLTFIIILILYYLFIHDRPQSKNSDNEESQEVQRQRVKEAPNLKKILGAAIILSGIVVIVFFIAEMIRLNKIFPDLIDDNFIIVLPFEINDKPIRWHLSPIHLTIFLGLLIAILSYYFLFRQEKGVPKTKIGYEINVTGKNQAAGKTAGMSFFKVALITMILSGGFAGVAGVGEIAGNQLRLTPVSPGYGFTAIAVAYLGGLNPLGIIISALFFAALFIGGNAIKLTQGLPGTALDLFAGTILIFVLVAEFFLRYRLNFKINRRSE
ncbi:MAG: hypothetical protein HeimC3_43950 [Candidatus Heimdallarchaeota archaeon LC_3]|nr:MAG: hypothetical protein HeimC3_43950 [Candidatus Heimdallarchaeota archaeon LC_3]